MTGTPKCPVGPVQRAVRAHLHGGQRLETPGRSAPFTLERIDQDGIVLLLGRGQHRTRIPWGALETVPDLFRNRGWLPTSGSYAPNPDTTTLDGHLKQYVYRETSNWVAVVLEKAGVLELDRSRPIIARLTNAFR